MKSCVPLVLAGLVLISPHVVADDRKQNVPPDNSLKVVVDQLEKAWETKLKSSSKKEIPAKGKDASAKTEFEIKLTLEFTKDVTDLAEFRKTFIALPGPPRQFATHPLVFHLFDKDNVSLGKYNIRRIEGELSGSTGDSFRAVLICDTETLSQATKLEARLLKEPSKK